MDEQKIQSTSQLFSNIYLSRLDDFVKRELKLRHYGRYVDDFYIVGCCKEELLAAIPVIRNFLLRALGLRLHPRKVHLTDVRKGVRFLGAVIKPYQRYACHRGLSRASEHKDEVLVGEYNPRSLISKFVCPPEPPFLWTDATISPSYPQKCLFSWI